MTLLRQIQDAAVSDRQPLATVLRMCKLLAARLGSKALADWIQWESDGYPNGVELPTYRVFLHATLKGDFAGSGLIAFRRIEIPTAVLPNEPKELRTALTTCRFRQSVSAIEDLLRHETPIYELSVPSDALILLSDRVLEGTTCMKVWREVPRTFVVDILNAVRGRILDFSLAIEKEAPSAGESEIGQQALPPQAVNQVVHQHIYGSGSTVLGQAVDTTVTTITVLENDFRSLQEALASVDIAAKDIQSLEDAIKQDPKPTDRGKFGARVTKWLRRILAKGTAGAGDLASQALAKALSAWINQYYGW